MGGLLLQPRRRAALLLQPRPRRRAALLLEPGLRRRAALLLMVVGTTLQGAAGQAAQPRWQQVSQVLCVQHSVSAALLEVKHSALPVLFFCCWLLYKGASLYTRFTAVSTKASVWCVLCLNLCIHGHLITRDEMISIQAVFKIHKAFLFIDAHLKLM